MDNMDRPRRNRKNPAKFGEYSMELAQNKKPKLSKLIHPLLTSSTVNVNVDVNVNQSVRSVTMNECNMDRPRRNRKNPARFEEIYSVEQGQQSYSPLLISSTVNECPLCSYKTIPEFRGNVARHFQAKHKIELQLILSGNTSIEGISKRTRFRSINSSRSAKIQESDLSRFSTSSRKPTLTVTVTEKADDVPVPASIRQSRRGPPLLFIKAEGEKCPLCKYFSSNLTSAARHFQARHKAQAQQVLNGRAVYPGISIKLRNGSTSSSSTNGKMKSTVAVKPVSQRRSVLPSIPRFLKAEAGKCPSCNYTSEFSTNLSRHFQVNHIMQVKDILKGNATYTGINLRDDYSNPAMKKKLISLMVQKAARASSRPYRSMPIRIKAGKCPLCEYYSSYSTNLAYHFQCRHKLELEQVMSAKATYPGISKREIKRGIYAHGMPVSVDDPKSNVPQMSFEQQKRKENSQNYKVEVTVPDFQAGFERSVSSAKQLKVKDVKPEPFAKEVKVKQARIVKIKMNQNTNTPENVIYCAAPNCHFTTSSRFQLSIHENVHSIINNMPPFIKGIITAPKLLNLE